MEQITQQISQEPFLPIKTKGAVWWIIIGSIISIIWITLIGLFFESHISMLFLSFSLPYVISLIFSSLLLLFKKKWFWCLTIIFLIPLFSFSLIMLPVSTFSLPSFLGVSTLIPFILFLQDRKNFFKIAS
jgi:hypothetical protein